MRAGKLILGPYVIAASLAVAVSYYFAPIPVSCVIRNTGDGWTIVEDDHHRPINCASVEVATDAAGRDKLRLFYSFEARQVHSLVVGADEAFVGRYHAGASVGLSRANIYFSDSDGAHLSPHDVYDEWGNFFVQGYLSR